MLRLPLIVCIVLCALISTAQWNYHVQQARGINTSQSEFACDIVNGGLLTMTNAINPKMEERTWKGESSNQLYFHKKLNDFGNFEEGIKLFSHSGNRNEGPITFDPQDSVYYFSTANDFEKGVYAGQQKIYVTSAKKGALFDPVLLPFCKDGFEYTCPYFDADLRVLVFSSDRAGGHGGWDIWYAYLTESTWTNPANCGGQVNTSSSELFPTIHKGDIYFSSNGWLPERGYELFKAEGKEQWMNAIQLEYPLNSEGNDYRILFLNDDRGLLSSERKMGMGGSDIYIFERSVQRFDAVSFSGKLISNAVEMPGIEIEVFNSSDELVSSVTSNHKGDFDFTNLQFETKYTFRLKNVLPALRSRLELLVLDEGGNIIRSYKFNDKGEIVLELLKFIYSDIAVLDNRDESILGLSFEGRVIPKGPSVAIQKIPIAIVDKEGEIIAVAYTSLKGEFHFDNLSPQRQYTFRVAEKSLLDRIVLFDNGKSIVLPLLKGEAYYQRLSRDEGIELMAPSGETLVISENDVLVVNRIYFGLNSSKIEGEAVRQLAELSELLKLNSHLSIKVNGYTDSRGSADYNRKLSERRSLAIQNFLVAEGIAKSRIQTNGFGEGDLINECSDANFCEEGQHAINRRTEIKFKSDLK